MYKFISSVKIDIIKNLIDLNLKNIWQDIIVNEKPIQVLINKRNNIHIRVLQHYGQLNGTIKKVWSRWSYSNKYNNFCFHSDEEKKEV